MMEPGKNDKRKEKWGVGEPFRRRGSGKQSGHDPSEW